MLTMLMQRILFITILSKDQKSEIGVHRKMLVL